MTPLEHHVFNANAYRAAIREALVRGDKAKAAELQEALRQIEKKECELGLQ